MYKIYLNSKKPVTKLYFISETDSLIKFINENAFKDDQTGSKTEPWKNTVQLSYADKVNNRQWSEL